MEYQEDDEYVESNISPGCAYSIFDFFMNNKFNMVYVQKMPDWELKMRKEYLEAQKETTNRKTREQIMDIKKKRKDLKAMTKEEDRKRFELMSKEPLSFKLYRIVSNMLEEKPLCIVCPFNEEEIYIAKKCIINRLTRPPNYYDFYDEKKEEKAGASPTATPGNTSNQQTVVDLSNEVDREFYCCSSQAS